MHGKIDADLRTSALHGTPSVQSVHDYYPFALEDGDRLAPMAVELVNRLPNLVVVRRFRGMGTIDSRSLRSDIYVPMHHFVRQTTFVPFRRFGGNVWGEFMLCISAALHGTLGSHLRDALHEGNVNAEACLNVPRAYVLTYLLLVAWWSPLLFLVVFYYSIARCYTSSAFQNRN
jgi:hypothetical protein